MRRVVYLMSGPGYMPYLITSLATLRHHWKADVHVHAWPESHDIVEEIAADDRLRIKVIKREPVWRGKNSQFADKILLMREQTDVSSALYLDADTLVAGDLYPLFETAERRSFAATQFCGWKTNGSIIGGRIKRLRDFPQLDQDLVEEVLSKAYPSPNGGVFACTSHSPVLPLWHEWTLVVCEEPPPGTQRWRKGVFIADETVLQIMLLKMPQHISIMEGGAFNCSPKAKYRPEGLSDDRIKIWHGHGNCFARPDDKSPEGYQMWRSVWDRCIELNLGNVRNWAGRCQSEHKHLKKMESLCTPS